MSHEQAETSQSDQIDMTVGSDSGHAIYTGGGDFIGRDQNIRGDVVQGDKITAGTYIQQLFQGNLLEAQQLRARATLLANVRRFWIEGVLQHSLPNDVMIMLALEEEPSAVDNRPWAMVLQTPELPNRTLPPATSIVDVFDQQQQRLLILGAPGSGKTTLLLALADELLKRAENDPVHPAPVVFNLSSWAAKRQPLAEWLVVELNEKYKISEKMAAAWVADDALLLLLDGLDEVQSAYRPACVVAINAFCKAHPVTLTVCSRIDEYEELESKLQLCGAVYLCPLSPEQIHHYFTQVAVERDDHAIERVADQVLPELLRSPLLLNIVTLLAQEAQLSNLDGVANLELGRKQLLALYIQHMFERRSANKPYSTAKTLHCLAWLAQQMLTNGQSVFLIERMQPGWLQHRWQQLLYHVLVLIITTLPISLLAGIGVERSVRYGVDADQAVRLGIIAGLVYLLTAGLFVRNIFGVVGGTLVGLAFGTAFFVTFTEYTWLPRLQVGLLAGALFGAGYSYIGRFWPKSDPDEIAVVEELAIFWPRAMVGAAVGLLLGFGLGLLFWWGNREIIAGKNLLLDVGIAFGFSFAVAGGIAVGLLQGLRSKPILIHTFPNQGIFSSAQNALRVFTIIGTIFCLLFGADAGFVWYRFYTLNGLQQPAILPVSLWVGLTLGPAIGILISLLFGGLACIQHFILRIMLYFTGCTPWNYARFLDYSVERIFLRKVGGGYIFTHRLLLEHFAALTEEEIQRLNVHRRQSGKAGKQNQG